MKRYVFVLVLLLAVSPLIADIPVLVHAHDHDTDGIHSTSEVAALAADHGARAVIMTAHLEMLNRTEPQGLGQKVKRCGVANYIADVEQANRDLAPRGVRVLIGGEIGGGENRHNHMLVLGGNPRIYEALTKIADDLGDNASDETTMAAFAKVARIAHNAGAAVIAAHPNIDNFGFMQYQFNEWAEFLDGLEFMNHGLRDSDQGLAQIWQKLNVKYRKGFAITAGADFHGDIVESAGSELTQLGSVLDRHVVVRTDNPDDIIGSIRRGNSYIATAGANLDETNLPIGNEVVSDKPIYFDLSGLLKRSYDVYFTSDSGETREGHANTTPGTHLRIDMDPKTSFGGESGQALLIVGGRFVISFRVIAPGDKLAEQPTVVASEDDQPINMGVIKEIARELKLLIDKINGTREVLSPAGQARLDEAVAEYERRRKQLSDTQGDNGTPTIGLARAPLKILRALADKAEEIARAEGAGGSKSPAPADNPTPTSTEQPLTGETNRIPTGGGVFYGTYIFGAGDLKVWLDVSTKTLYVQPPGQRIKFERLPALKIEDETTVPIHINFTLDNILGTWLKSREFIDAKGQFLKVHVSDAVDLRWRLVFDVCFSGRCPEQPDGEEFLFQANLHTMSFYQNANPNN